MTSPMHRVSMSPHHGICLPLSALHSKNSCGTGEFFDLLPLIDWCQALHLDVIQLLPLNNSAHDPSPYNGNSSCAIHFGYLSLHALPFLTPTLQAALNPIRALTKSPRIQYNHVHAHKLAWLRTYFESCKEKLLSSRDYRTFLADNAWVAPYALFCVLKDLFMQTSWTTWPEPMRHPDKKAYEALLEQHKEEISFYSALQFLCYEQLKSVKHYANQRGLFLMGDIPILLSKESADVWFSPEYFDLSLSAGAPPDAYNKEGQFWGFPLYKWDVIKDDHYLFWKNRLRYASCFYDIYRIDHIIGFFRIWAIPSGAPSKEGHFIPEDTSFWQTQGTEILTQFLQFSPMLPIGEDLGIVPPIVRPCLQKLGIPGTKVMRWEKTRAGSFTPIQEYPPLSLTTVSTHDTETLTLWWMNEVREAQALCAEKRWAYAPKPTQEQLQAILWDSHHSASLFHVNLLQEYLALHSDLVSERAEEERINIPGTQAENNWTYRFRPSVEALTSHQGLRASMQAILLLLLTLLLPIAAIAKIPRHHPSNKHAEEHTQNTSLKSLYNSLDPLSISEHLAFYELYPHSPEGKRALAHVGELLKGESGELIGLPAFDIQAIISLVTRQPFDPPVKLSEEQLQLVEKAGGHLANRTLKGHQVWTQAALLALAPEEVDLARGLLLYQFDAKDPTADIRQYEASLDLMALQVSVRLPKGASDEEKIKEINRFIFQEMQFRFPPHSIYAKEIDLYTFLPSVLDSRQGVCLGVSILYLALAQRLNLPLEIITPPGHIYVRYRTPSQTINIETTARGINTPSDVYLGINTRSLKQRNMKEVIGLALFNQASVHWGKEEYATTVSLYEKALPFLPHEPLLKMLLGFNYLFVGKTSEGKRLLEQIKDVLFDDTVSSEGMVEDYLRGKVNADGLKAIFLPVDETRESIVKKQKHLESILKRYPQFRAGLLQLATTWLQLGRGHEAMQVLERYHALDPTHCITEYYLAMLAMQRLDYNRAWDFLKRTEALTTARSHYPKALKSTKDTLRTLCPETIPK